MIFCAFVACNRGPVAFVLRKSLHYTYLTLACNIRGYLISPTLIPPYILYKCHYFHELIFVYLLCLETESDLYTTAIDQTISGKDANANHMENEENHSKEPKEFEHYARHFDVSDETDSDIESVRCVYCNGPQSNRGAHKCHVTCTIEKDAAYTSSSETLVASDTNPARQDMQLVTSSAPPDLPPIPELIPVPCVLCDAKFDDYDAYVLHVNKCTANVKLHHYVCPICHEIYTEKMLYLQHLKDNHFNKNNDTSYLTVSEDCVDNFVSITSEKSRRPTSVRRQIGWSIEDIYQEIDCKPIEKETPSSSPMKAFFKFGNE